MNTTSQTIDRLYAAIAERDVAGIARTLTPDAVLHVPGRHPLAGRYTGPAEILGFLAGTGAAAGDGETVEVLDVLVGHEHAAAYVRSRARRGDAELDNLTLHLMRTTAGAVAEIWFHNRDQEHVDAFWGGAYR